MLECTSKSGLLLENFSRYSKILLKCSSVHSVFTTRQLSPEAFVPRGCLCGWPSPVCTSGSAHRSLEHLNDRCRNGFQPYSPEFSKAKPGVHVCGHLASTLQQVGAEFRILLVEVITEGLDGFLPTWTALKDGLLITWKNAYHDVISCLMSDI